MQWIIGIVAFFGVDFIATLLIVYLYKKYKKN